jgi:acetyl-CoA C-acetyltransferase
MAEREIVVVGAVRTPIGSFGGALKDVDLIALATTACRGVLERSGTPADAVGHVVMGNVIPTEPRDGYLARVAAVVPVFRWKPRPSTSTACAARVCRP